MGSKYSKIKTNYLDIDALFEQYKPLMGSIYKRFSRYNGVFNNQADYEDLRSQIEFEFIKLCNEFDPTRGVDFPGFIKFHLQQRVYHHITKVQKLQSKESASCSRVFDSDGDSSAMEFDNTLDLIDEDSIKSLERVEAMASLDWRAIVGKKHKYLIESVLYEGKTIEEIAFQEGVVVKVIQLRLHFACERLKEWCKNQEYYMEYKKVHPEVPWEDFVAMRKQVQKIKRTPIVIIRVPIVIRVSIIDTLQV